MAPCLSASTAYASPIVPETKIKGISGRRMRAEAKGLGAAEGWQREIRDNQVEIRVLQSVLKLFRSQGIDKRAIKSLVPQRGRIEVQSASESSTLRTQWIIQVGIFGVHSGSKFGPGRGSPQSYLGMNLLNRWCGT